jgi:hypothetical protein
MRPMAVKNTMKRRPPRTRSITGPMNGPTTAKGRTVQMRPMAVLPRAALSDTLTKTEPANATTTNASPADDRACTMASPPKGVEVSLGPGGPRRNG